MADFSSACQFEVRMILIRNHGGQSRTLRAGFHAFPRCRNAGIRGPVNAVFMVQFMA